MRKKDDDKRVINVPSFLLYNVRSWFIALTTSIMAVYVHIVYKLNDIRISDEALDVSIKERSLILNPAIF